MWRAKHAQVFQLLFYFVLSPYTGEVQFLSYPGCSVSSVSFKHFFPRGGGRTLVGVYNFYIIRGCQPKIFRIRCALPFSQPVFMCTPSLWFQLQCRVFRCFSIEFFCAFMVGIFYINYIFNYVQTPFPKEMPERNSWWFILGFLTFIYFATKLKKKVVVSYT